MLVMLPLSANSLGRLLVIYLLLLLYYFSLLYFKSVYKAFLLFLTIALPFNITMQVFSLTPNHFVSGIEVNYLIFTVSVLDLGVFIFLLTLLLSKQGKVLKKVFVRYKYPLLVFSLFLLVQNIVISNPISFLASLRMLSYLFTALIFLEKAREFKMQDLQKHIPLFSILLLVSTSIQGILGILQFRGGSSVGLKLLGESQVVSGMMGSSFVTLQNQVFLRAYGTFPHPNVLAGYFLLLFLISFFLCKRLKGKYRIISIATMLLSSIFVLFTFSRFTILLFLIATVAMIISNLVKKQGVKSLNFLPLLVERYEKSLSGGDESLLDRLNLAKTSIYVLKNNWTFGTGLGRFTAEMGEVIPRSSKGILLIQPVHNVFLLLLTELGVFGFLSFAYLLFTIIKMNVKKLTLLGILIIVSVLGIASIDHYLVSLPQGLAMLWLLLGLLALESK